MIDYRVTATNRGTRMIIRHARPDDAGDVFVAHGAHPDNGPWDDAEDVRARIAWMTKLGTPPIVAEVEGRVVAEMEVWWGRDVVELGRTLDVSMIEVHPDHRGAGIGRRLMERAIDLAREKECDGVSVWTDPDVIGFYGKLGFEERLVLGSFVLPVFDAGTDDGEFRAVHIADLDRPAGPSLETMRVLHPKQQWHERLREEISPPRWRHGEPRRPVVSAAVSGKSLAIYRRHYWRDEPGCAQLDLWQPVFDRDRLREAVAHAATLDLHTIDVHTCGRVADALVDLGATPGGEERILFRARDAVA